MGDFITGSIVALISFALGLFGNMWYGNYREKKKIQNESLKNHFKQLETNAIKPISKMMERITDSGGTLWEYGDDRAYNPTYRWPPTKAFEEGDFHIFKLHFRSQADAVAELMNKIDKHNEDCQSFTNELKELIEEKTGLAVREGKECPFIYEHVPTYLRQTLYQLVKSESPTHDFQQTSIERKGDFWRVRTVSTIYADVTTEREGNSFKNDLTGLMESTSLLKETTDIYLEAQKLEKESRSLASLLDFICDQHDRYGKLLKREESCPICKVIFEEEQT